MENKSEQYEIPDGNERVHWFRINILRLLNTEQMNTLREWLNTYETNLEQPNLSDSNHAEQKAAWIDIINNLQARGSNSAYSPQVLNWLLEHFSVTRNNILRDEH